MLKLEFMGEFLVYRLYGLEVSKVSIEWSLFGCMIATCCRDTRC